MFLRPAVIFTVASRAAQRPIVNSAPAVFSRMYSVPADNVQTRVLDVVKGFDKVDAAKVNSFTKKAR
jgi:NADH dehydrogenase (ubiquinone) 1 alpha/beta subcomplex 1